ASRYRAETLAVLGDATAPHGGDQQLRGTSAYPALLLSFVLLPDCRRGADTMQLPGREPSTGQHRDQSRRALAEALSRTSGTLLSQEDTFFHTPQGRL